MFLSGGLFLIPGGIVRYAAFGMSSTDHNRRSLRLGARVCMDYVLDRGGSSPPRQDR